MKTNKYNNCVILHDGTNGEAIREFWEGQGVYTYSFLFNSNGSYYGLLDNKFVSLYENETKGLKIITLPINDYPKVMEVSNYPDFTRKKIRVVEFEKKNLFYAWNSAETFEEAEHQTVLVSWEFVREIQPTKRTLTINDIAKLAGCDVNDLVIDMNGTKIVKK